MTIAEQETKMYDALEVHANDFNAISRLLSDPAASARVDAIREALKQTAERIAKETATNEQDRKTLSTLYRGFVAASRILNQLQSRESDTYQ
jgi:hypothetical protein